MITKDSGPSFSGLIGQILSVIGVMGGTYAVLKPFLGENSLVTPISAIVSGLIITAILVQIHKWNRSTALATWGMSGVGLFLTYTLFIVITPTRVTGTVIDPAGSPMSGLHLTLLDHNGVAHYKITDKNGYFEFSAIPEGDFRIMIDNENNELLIMGQIPSIWGRISLKSTVDLGSPAHKPTPTAIPTPIPIPTATPTQPIVTSTFTPSPIPATDTPTSIPTLTLIPTSAFTPNHTPLYYSLTVPANVYWYDTNITIMVGDKLEVRATGYWNSGLGPSDPNGLSGQPCKCLVDEPIQALIGRIGENHPSFKIGIYIRMPPVQIKGKLFLTMNENTGNCTDDPSRCYQDNTGSLDVTIVILR